MQSCWKHPFPPVRRAFTLAELLIVIAIIILVLAMAVPAFRALTGSRSTENATNVISANLSRARLAAIRDQQPRGLVFYRDRNNDRVAVAIATYYTDNNSPPNSNCIDVVAETDVQYLPGGVSIAFQHQTGGANYTYRLVGNAEDLYGLIMFNSQGHFMHSTYRVNDDRELGRRLGLTSNIVTSDGEPPYTQPAFLLFERSAFDNITDTGDRIDWLNDNASVLLINRYNGTLTRSE